MIPFMRRSVAGLVGCACLSAILLASCGSTQARGPYNSDGTVARDIPKAEALYRKATLVLTTDAVAAEKLLRETLGFDLYHGAAHNDLGVLLLKQGKLYDAAEEFQWARTLLPGHPEPSTNLAITLERGGKHQEALDSAHSALEMRPGDLDAMECLALIQVRERLADKTTLTYLDSIIQRSNVPAWTDWARRERFSVETSLQEP